MLEISVLGTPQIKQNEHIINSFESRTVEAILFYLAVTNNVHSREALAEFFWGERTQSQSLSNLRTALHRLRHFLDPYINVSRTTVALNMDANILLDTTTLLHKLEQIDSHNLLAVSAENLELALDLYRGPFLDGFYLRDCVAFEAWLLRERETWQVRLVDWLDKLIRFCLQSGVYLPAITQASRLIEIDPLREESYQLMMILLAKVGQRNAAIETYHRYERISQQEFALKPSGELLQLRGQILADEILPDIPHQIAINLSPAKGRIINPYKGLLAFDEADANLFFGHENLIEIILQRLREPQDNRLLVLVGPSGVGKSSLVYAGVIPALRREGWQDIRNTVPGYQPMQQIASLFSDKALSTQSSVFERVSDVTTDHSLLLVIDQLEEVFTLVNDESKRLAFLSLLTTLVQSELPINIILTLRADFYDGPLRYPDFGRLVAQNTLPVLPLTVPELEKTILAPAINVGLAFEDGLVAQIITDVNNQASALPLMQYTLLALTELREGRMLTWNAYHKLGGVIGALVQRANAVFEHLSSLEQNAVRQLFLRLIISGEERPDTRRRLYESELRGSMDTELFTRIVEEFTLHRLLVRDYNASMQSATVEIAHEALIKGWDRFQGWLDTYRVELHHYRQLAVMTQNWLDAQHDPGYLASGARLFQFELLLESDLALSEQEREFIDLSKDERLRLETLDRDRRTHEGALRLAMESAQMLDRGATGEIPMLLALHSLSMHYTPSGDSALLRALQKPLLRQRYARHDYRIIALACSKDGRYLITGGNDKTLRLWDAHSAQCLRVINDFDTPVTGITFAPDSLSFAATHSGNVASIWSLDETEPAHLLVGHSAEILAIAWSDDGHWLATSSIDRTIRLWKVDSLSNVHTFLTDEVATLLAFSPDNRFLVSANDTLIYLWEFASSSLPQVMAGHQANLTAICFGMDGRYLLSGSADGTARLWKVASGQTVQTFTGHQEGVVSVLFDGETIITAAQDRKVYRWHFSDEVVQLITEYPDEITCAAFSPDSKILYIGGLATGELLAYGWQSIQTVEPRIFAGHTGWVTSAVFSPDGTYIASSSWDSTIRLWDMASGRTVRIFTHSGQPLKRVIFSPDGSRLLSGCDDGIVRMWEIATGNLLRTYTGHTSAITGITFSPDGRFIVTGSLDTTIRLWSTDTAEELQRFVGHKGAVYTVVLSPDGRFLFSPSADGTGRLWDVEQGHCLRVFNGHTDWVLGTAFSPDGNLIVTTSIDRTVRLWDVASASCLHVFTGHTGLVRSVDFSPDGQFIITGSEDRSIRLWNVDTGQQVRLFSAHEDGVWRVVFSPDGRYVLSASADHTVRLWRVNINDVIEYARDLLSRELTTEERALYSI